MGTHIVYLENRLGNRQTTDVIDEPRAIRIAKEMTDNGVIAEVFPLERPAAAIRLAFHKRQDTSLRAIIVRTPIRTSCGGRRNAAGEA